MISGPNTFKSSQIRKISAYVVKKIREIIVVTATLAPNTLENRTVLAFVNFFSNTEKCGKYVSVSLEMMRIIPSEIFQTPA